VIDERILQIETFALHAWPPELTRPLGGWLIRRHPSLSRRVNSVWPNAWLGEMALDSRLERVEAVYAGWNRPARYQICPAAIPRDLDRVLEARGYTIDAPTSVQISATRQVITASQVSPPGRPIYRIKVLEQLTMSWVSAYCRVQGAPQREVPLRMVALGRVARPAVYIQIDVHGEPAAVGRGVLEDGWFGVFGMATGPDYRRRGLATATLGALASWALDQRAEHMYLQVMLDNTAALNCYAGMGFARLYGYHYRQQNSTREG